MQLYDLSLGGCFVASLHAPPENGRPFSLRIDLPDHGSIDVKVEARFYLPTFGYGVRFVRMTDEGRQRLDAALAALTTPLE